MNPYKKFKDAIANLTPEQHRVTQQGGTERPGTGEYLNQVEGK
jgi:peptide-methionine (R)-S-oxide reductase